MYIQKITDTQNKAHAIRHKLLNPANKVTQSNVEALQKRLRNALDAIDSMKLEMDSRESEIATLKLDVADRNARILAQADLLAKMNEEDDISGPKYKSVRQICLEVLKDYPGITIEHIYGVCRQRSLVEPRRRCHYEVFRQRPDLSSVSIGRYMKRDHSTILHSIEKYQELFDAGNK